MTSEMFKTFMRLLIGIVMRIPLTALGAWLLAHSFVSPGEWTFVVEGISLLVLTISWSLLERYGVLKALDNSRMDVVDAKQLVQIALDLPKGATLEDALLIHQRQKVSNE